MAHRRVSDDSHHRPSPSPSPFPWGDLPDHQFYHNNQVKTRKGRFTSVRGISLFTQLWLPSERPPRAVLCMCHGYGTDISWTFQQTAVSFTQMGYAAFAMDLQGHGQSEGLRGHLPSLDHAAHDCQMSFAALRQEKEFLGLPCFLYGESLGGALCLLLHFLDPQGWDGAILVAPMCRISDTMWPPWPLPGLLTLLARWVPTWPLVPSKDMVDKSIADPVKRLRAKGNPRRYSGQPRLGTAAELLRATTYISQRLKDVTLPFLVLHGDADTVTDPSVSRALYASAASPDKTLKLYKGARHALLQGEPDETVATILEDISSWLRERVERKSKN